MVLLLGPLSAAAPLTVDQTVHWQSDTLNPTPDP